ncbi:hypothetical protein DEU38_103189 [Rhodococcus sp. AG1013]|uniref:hypothetical protein n=1 Tax=Rhodococcus sp. AG1013 TaxID=2183996 RepID=UPI000E0B53BD|nr:hypothetical protein [Rhodococcus sp. AG1013]RDI32456.1 hypothetical protein DEU38_103189 [Rhodococcus sp. AG1013]
MAINTWLDGAYRPLRRASVWGGGYQPLKRALVWDGGQYKVVWEAAASYYDNFERPDGSPGSNWFRRPYGNTAVVPVISGGSLRAAPTPTNNQNNQCSGVYLPQCTTDDLAVRATVTRDSNGLSGGLLVGCDQYIAMGLAVSFTSATAHRGVWSIVNSNWVRRVDTALSCTTGDVIEVTRVGTYYSVYKNGVAQTNWNDSTGIVPRGIGNRGGGYHGHSDVNLFGSANYGMTIGDITIYDIVS